MVIHLIGGGGHASVVADVARRCGFTEFVIWSEAEVDLRRFPANSKVLAFADLSSTLPVVLAFGDLAARQEMRRRYPVAAPALIDPSAVVGGGVIVGEGAVIFPGCIVNANARVSVDAILNTGSIVEHDCVVGQNTHLSPGVRLAGAVTIGDNTHVGTGAIILPGLRVGNGCVIGAGAVVLDDVPSGTTVVGVPAKALQRT